MVAHDDDAEGRVYRASCAAEWVHVNHIEATEIHH
jgi:hypothetical protein